MRQPAGQRLHRSDLDGLIRGLNTCGDDAVLNAGQGELGSGLRDQLTAVDQHHGTAATIGERAKDLGHHNCFAAAGAHNKQRSARSMTESKSQIINGSALI
jgi:hypothetical protein